MTLVPTGGEVIAPGKELISADDGATFDIIVVIILIFIEWFPIGECVIFGEGHDDYI